MGPGSLGPRLFGYDESLGTATLWVPNLGTVSLGTIALWETTKKNETTMEGFGKEHEAMETIEREEVVQGGGSVGDNDWMGRMDGAGAAGQRQRDMVAAAVTTFCAELRERFDEVDRDKWQRAVMRMMRENHLENMGMLREACEKAGHSEGESAEPLKKEIHKLNAEKVILQDAWKEENAIIKQELQRLEEEKKTAQEIVDKLKKALKEEKRVAEAMKKNLQSVQGQLIEARRTRETVEAMLEERDRRQTLRSSSTCVLKFVTGISRFLKSFKEFP
uniref:Uncharacterized protein n=1 Tax=Caenorhabditis japonica TaxID=281687 RepID=A0A8R1EHK0_CAEJA